MKDDRSSRSDNAMPTGLIKKEISRQGSRTVEVGVEGEMDKGYLQ